MELSPTDVNAIIFGCTGLWMITWALIMNTKNFTSAFIFKVIPFFGGMANLIACAVNAGWIGSLI